MNYKVFVFVLVCFCCVFVCEKELITVHAQEASKTVLVRHKGKRHKRRKSKVGKKEAKIEVERENAAEKDAEEVEKRLKAGPAGMCDWKAPELWSPEYKKRVRKILRNREKDEPYLKGRKLRARERALQIFEDKMDGKEYQEEDF